MKDFEEDGHMSNLVMVQRGWAPSYPINQARSGAFSASLCVTRDEPGCLHHFVQQKLLHRWSRWSTDGTWTLFHRRFRTRAQHIWYATRSIFALICLSLYIEGTICHPAMLWLQCNVWRTWLVKSFKQPGWPVVRKALSHLTTEIKSAEGDRRVQLYIQKTYKMMIPK